MGPLVCRFFSITAIVPRYSVVAEFLDVEPQKWMSDYKAVNGLSTTQGSVPFTHHIIQEQTVYIFKDFTFFRAVVGLQQNLEEGVKISRIYAALKHV